MDEFERRYERLLKQLIAFNTVSSQSNLELQDFITSYLKSFQFDTYFYYNNERTKANLIATIGPKGGRGLMLSAHTDVVPTTGQQWHSSPFELIKHNDRLIGRGTADMKGFIALVLDVIASLDLSQLQKPLHLVFTYDEEIGCFGAKALIDELKVRSSTIEFALIGEPTNHALVNAHKGLQARKTEFIGKPAHSSNPNLGHSAIMSAALFLQRLSSMLPNNHDERFNPPSTTFNAGTICGGNALNIIAERCALDWECRPLPCVSEDELSKALQTLTDDVQESTKIDINHHVLSLVPGLTNDMNDTALSIVKRYLPSDVCVTTAPFLTEAGLFQQASIPTLVFGPGEIEQAHQPNESISLAAMESYRQFLIDLIGHYCQ